MPSKRTPTGRRSKARITPEAVALFKRALALYDQQDAWEEDGGRRREYLEVTCDLQDVLGPHPVARKRARHPRAEQPPAYMAGDAKKLADYKRAVAIRRELEKAAKSS